MLLAAARTLADQVDRHDLTRGSVYPPLKSIRRFSLEIVVSTAEQAYASEQARYPRPVDLREHIAERMYDPTY